MTIVPEAIDHDVWGTSQQQVSDNLISACASLADTLNDEQSRLDSAANTASIEFKGYFSELFAQNMAIQREDKNAIISALNAVVAGLQDAQEQAEQEQARIERAREWQREHDRWERGRENALFGGFFYDWTHSEPEINPKDITAGVAPRITFSPPTTRDHEVPAPGTVAKGSATSSAIPNNLDTFVAAADRVYDELEVSITLLANAYDAFEYGWTWKSGATAISGMSTLIATIRKYNEANLTDGIWIELIASAFRQISDGSHAVSMSDQALALVIERAGINAHRQNVKLPELALVGMVPTTGYAADPINTATGNFIEPETDLAFGESATSLRLTRMYNSIVAQRQLQGDLPLDGVFGCGWSSVLDQRLHLDDDVRRWVTSDGRRIFFYGDGDVIRADRENFWLERTAIEGTQIWRVSDNQGQAWLFDSHGRWIRLDSADSNGLRIEHGSDGEVSAIIHDRGRRFDLEYSDGLVCVVRSCDGRSVEYEYDDDRNLIGVVTAHGKRRYVIGDQGLIESVVSAAGVVEAKNTYDDAARVTAQVSQFGRTTRFAYLPAGVTVVSDEDGNRSNTWICDTFGRTVGMIDSEDQRHSMVYDSFGNLILSTDRSSDSTFHVYDERGRRTKTILPSRSELAFEYDELDRLTATITQDGAVSTFEYDGASRQSSKTVDPLGGETVFDWRDGLLTKVTDPVGVVVTFSYNELGDLTGVTNAAGDRTVLVRDGAGRVVKSVTPLGHVTSFTYTDAGELASRVDPDGATWRYAYDHAGRLEQVIDPLGAVTRFEYGAHGEVVRSIDPLGRVVEREFDDLGNVSSARLPDGSTFGYVHDALSRLEAMVDPAGNTWSYGYGAVGDLVSVTDPTGRTNRTVSDVSAGTLTVQQPDGLPEYTSSIDECGRLTKITYPSESSEIITYDAAGRPVEFLDADGGLTILRRDKAGRVVEHVSPGGSITAYAYDECGRLARVINPGGGRSVLNYDADSRLVETVGPSGETSSYQYDECGRLTRAHVAGKGLEERRYDAAGRLVFIRNLETGVRRFTYDLAGQLVQVSNGVGGATHYEYDVRGRVVSITDPKGAVTRREYNELNQITCVTDPLGRSTYATYDAAGRQVTQTNADGTEIRFEYDANGQREATYANDRLLSRIERDSNTVRVFDSTDPLRPEPRVHTLTYDRLGRLVGYECADGLDEGRSIRKSTWTYDAEGRRTSYTTANGQTTSYHYDVAGNLERVSHPVLGEATFSYDKSGRIIGSAHDGAHQKWSFTNGFVTKHTCAFEAKNAEEATIIERDTWGRVKSLKTADGMVTYAYDDANQLVSLSSNTGQATTWSYDEAGYLTTMCKTQGEQQIESAQYSYDEAGQIRAVNLRQAHGDYRLDYDYNESGQRTKMRSSTGAKQLWRWDERGWLKRFESLSHRGERTTVGLDVDFFGVVRAIDDVVVDWDLTSFEPQLSAIGDQSVVGLPGGQWLGHTGLEHAAWRGTWPTQPTDPFAVPNGSQPGFDGPLGAINSALPAGVELGSGGLNIGGALWLGARLYDPMTHSFLTPDPLANPAPGTLWETNPYNYVANNPLSFADPTGYKPLTDADIQAYNDTRIVSGATRVVNGVKHFGSNLLSWNTLGGLAMMAVGGAMTFTGFLAPTGTALIAGGASVILEQGLTGGVDWRGNIIGTIAGLGAGRLLTAAGRYLGRLDIVNDATALLSRRMPSLSPGANQAVRMGGKFAYHTVEDGLASVGEYGINQALGRDTPSFGQHVYNQTFSPHAVVLRGGSLSLETGLKHSGQAHLGEAHGNPQLLKARAQQQGETLNAYWHLGKSIVLPEPLPAAPSTTRLRYVDTRPNKHTIYMDTNPPDNTFLTSDSLDVVTYSFTGEPQ